MLILFFNREIGPYQALGYSFSLILRQELTGGVRYKVQEGARYKVQEGVHYKVQSPFFWQIFRLKSSRWDFPHGYYVLNWLGQALVELYFFSFYGNTTVFDPKSILTKRNNFKAGKVNFYHEGFSRRVPL